MKQSRSKYPILEFDPDQDAVIEPRRVVKPADVPTHCVVSFFQDVITRLQEDGQTTVIASLSSEIGTHPVYELAVDGQRVTLFHPGVGAPLAAGLLEEVIALGCEKFIACGGAGVLDETIALGHIVVPTTAVRDEGTSYHYLPPGREVAASPEAVAAIERTLKGHDIEYVLAKTWTTDAIYRETLAKVQLRRAEGCATVEMEAAALFAVARFRGVAFGQLLYGGDDVSSDEWDSRRWDKQTSVREKLLWLAAEACLAL